MKKKTVRYIFLFFLIYLPVQYAIVGVVGYYQSEPWPAFVFPGFKNVYSNQDQVEIVKPVFFEVSQEMDSTDIEINSSEIFKGLPISQVQGFVWTHFRDQKKYNNETRQWLRERVERITSSESISSLEIRWTAVRYTHADGKISEIDREITETIRISLREAR